MFLRGETGFAPVEVYSFLVTHLLLVLYQHIRKLKIRHLVLFGLTEKVCQSFANAVKPQATVFMGHFFNGFHGSTPYR
jgi:hypothetical protein